MVAEAYQGALDEVVAGEGAGEGHQPGERPGLEGAEAGFAGSEVGDEEELLPEVEAVGEASDVAEDGGFEQAGEPALRGGAWWRG